MSDPATSPVPPGLARGADIPWQPGGTVKCLASATFFTSTHDTCGEIWLLSADPELVAAHGTESALPNVFSAQGFNAPLGVITANCFGDSFFRVDPGKLIKHLSAIRDADSACLYAMNREYVPFYCPACRINYGGSEWVTGPIYDDGYFDYLEGICPKGHQRKIHD